MRCGCVPHPVLSHGISLFRGYLLCCISSESETFCGKHDYCAESPCKNGGYCRLERQPRGYSCHCHGKFIGSHCHMKLGEVATDCCAKSLKCENYRGRMSVTATGRTCQRWDEQTPHKHGYTAKAYPHAGLEGNYCRNPSNQQEAWCYTTDREKRWELCAVPDCDPCKDYR